MLRKLTPPIVLIAFAVAASGGSAEELRIAGMQSLEGTHHFAVHSKLLDWDYHVFVGVPGSYGESTDVTYPVVYLLDGGELFPLIRSYYRYLALADEAPELVIVGISYGTADWRSGNNRGHDYTAPANDRDFWGGASDFQSFLEKELVPFVESRFRVDKNRRIIFGQSLGGQFVLFTAQTRPDLFWGHISSNPALHRNLEFFLENASNCSKCIDTPLLFVASAAKDDRRFRDPATKWIEHWTNEKSRPWLLETVWLAGHVHHSAPPESFRQGVIWLFGQR